MCEDVLLCFATSFDTRLPLVSLVRHEACESAAFWGYADKMGSDIFQLSIECSVAFDFPIPLHTWALLLHVFPYTISSYFPSICDEAAISPRFAAQLQSVEGLHGHREVQTLFQVVFHE